MMTSHVFSKQKTNIHIPIFRPVIMSVLPFAGKAVRGVGPMI